MKNKALVIWNLLGAFLIPWSFIFCITNFLLSRVMWVDFIALILYLLLVPVAGLLSYLFILIEAQLQILWDADSQQKIGTFFRLMAILLLPFVPLALPILGNAVPYNIFVSSLFACTILLWTLPIAYWNFRQAQANRKNTL